MRLAGALGSQVPVGARPCSLSPRYRSQAPHSQLVGHSGGTSRKTTDSNNRLEAHEFKLNCCSDLTDAPLVYSGCLIRRSMRGSGINHIKATVTKIASDMS